jgi:glycosyltransferase involved in cell wall biosynthesis
MAQLKVFRTITSEFALKAHLSNTLNRLDSNLLLFVLGDDVTRLSSNYPQVVFIDIPIKRQINLLYDTYSLILLIYYCIKYRPQVIHSIMPKAGLLSALAGFLTFVPQRYHTFTGQIWITYKPIKKFLFIGIDKFINFLNSQCFTDSKSQSFFLYEYGIKSKFNKPLEYFLKGSLSGVDTVVFNPTCKLSENVLQLRVKLKIKKNDFVVLYMARKSIDKGAIDFLEMVNYLNSNYNTDRLKFLFIGPDESNGAIQSFYDEFGGINNLISIGTVSSHQNYIGVSDILCLPSHKEGFGSIVIDCAAMGIPTVGYNIVGLSDAIINNETGYLVKEYQIVDLAEKVMLLHNDVIKYNKMSERCIQNTLEYFNADLFYQKLVSLYSKR